MLFRYAFVTLLLAAFTTPVVAQESTESGARAKALALYTSWSTVKPEPPREPLVDSGDYPQGTPDWLDLSAASLGSSPTLPLLEKLRPILTEDSLTADQQPTPMAGVGAMCNLLNPPAGALVGVYGSGFDARMEITLARQYPTIKVIGLEYDPELAESARQYVLAAGLENRIEIRTEDATTSDLDVDYAMAYLWEETLAELVPKIKDQVRFVSFSHPIPGLGLRKFNSSVGDIYVYEKNPPMTRVRNQVAVWGNHSYTGRRCGNPSCRMCASIQNQLNSFKLVPATRQYASLPQGAVETQDNGEAGWHYETRTRQRKVCTRGLFGGTSCRLVTESYQVRVPN